MESEEAPMSFCDMVPQGQRMGKAAALTKNGKEQNFSGISIKLKQFFHFKEILPDTDTNF